MSGVTTSPAATTSAPAADGSAPKTAAREVPASETDRASRRDRVAKAREAAAAKHQPTKPRGQAFDPKRVAKAAMGERKQEKLRLATSDGERIEREAGEEDFDLAAPGKDAHAISPERRTPKPGAAGEIADDDRTDDEPEPEADKAPSWAKKIKAENAAHKDRETKWSEAVKQFEQTLGTHKQKLADTTFAVEDLTADVKFRDGLIKELVGLLTKSSGGRFVHESLDTLVQRHENAKLKRQMARGTKLQSEQATAQQRQAIGTEVKQRLDALRTKHPELNWEKIPAAKEFFGRYLRRGIPVEEISDAEINEFVSAQRFAAANAKRTRVEPGAAADEPPADEGSVRGQRARTTSRQSVPTVITKGYARKIVQDYRAAKAARS